MAISRLMFFAEGDGHEGDDRFRRWCEVNGITMADFEAKRPDGSHYVAYYREDGSEVDAATSYGYDAVLTPYTKSEGQA